LEDYFPVLLPVTLMELITLIIIGGGIRYANQKKGHRLTLEESFKRHYLDPLSLSVSEVAGSLACPEKRFR